MNDLRKEIINNPLEAIKGLLWGSNGKIGEIPSLIGESPLNCSSEKLGFCEVCRECYAKSDFKQYPSHRQRVLKSVEFFRLLKEDEEIYRLFLLVLEYYQVTELRYNLEGDFTDSSDIIFLKKLASDCPNIAIYGYSKRRDLKEELEKALKLPNFYCGVNFDCEGANFFEVVDNIEAYFFNSLKCLGDCNKCKKCYTLKGQHIAVFIHGSPSKIQKRINTSQNWEFMGLFIKEYLGVALPSDLPKGLFVKKINSFLESEGFEVPFTLTKKGNKTYSLNTVPKLINWVKFRGAL